MALRLLPFVIIYPAQTRGSSSSCVSQQTSDFGVQRMIVSIHKNFLVS
jgi:hypothetical protein